MANKGKIHVGDKNTDIQIPVEDTDTSDTNTAVDFSVTPATTLEILVYDPDGNLQDTLTASILNAPGSDGIIHSVNNNAALFDEPGSWQFKAHVIFNDGGDFTSNPIIKEVLG